MNRLDYIRDPAEIYRRSFAIADEEAEFGDLDDDLRPLARRLVHAAADPAIGASLIASPGASGDGVRALASGATIFADCEMVAAGITRRFLPRSNEIVVTLNHAETPLRAAKAATTRSAAAVDLWDARLAGAVVAIGNAPTALFRLIERLEEGGPVPSLVLGFPIGFVGATESKAALAERSHGAAFVTLPGRRGGSALAAAAVNALALGAGEASR